MRETTRGRVLAALLRHRPASRKQIARRTDVSAATVSRTVDQLIAEGLVVEVEELVEDRRGRRQVLLDVVPTTGLVLGVDLGASRTRCILADPTARPVASVDLPTPTALSPDDLAAWLGGVTTRLAAGHGPLRAAALGLPGAVAQDERTVSNAPNLPQVAAPGFLEACERSLGVPLTCDNDANYALLGEQHFGAAIGQGNAAMVTLGAGLGVGLAVDGRLVRGRRGLVGELGQLPVGPAGTRLETLVTGPWIVRRAGEAGVRLGEPAELFTRAGDPAVAELRAAFDHALLVVLASVTVACDPDSIVLGGGIAKSLRTELTHYAEALRGTLNVAPQLSYTVLGDFAGAAGATVAALHTLYGQLGVEDLAGLPAAGELTAQTVAAVAEEGRRA